MNGADIAIVTVVPVELQGCLRVFGLSGPGERIEGINYWRTTVKTDLSNECSVVISCSANQGNAEMGTHTSRVIATHNPRCALLVGIGAGFEAKFKMGDVALAERIVFYERQAVVEVAPGKEEQRNRQEQLLLDPGMQQDLAAFAPSTHDLNAEFLGISSFPKAPEGKEDDFEKSVAKSIRVEVPTTIGCGELLLRSATRLDEIRRIHNKIEVFDMESYGFGTACRAAGIPWLVIRGISDFGDPNKKDKLQAFAATTASVVARHFMQHRLVVPDYRRVAEARAAQQHIDKLLRDVDALLDRSRPFDLRLGLAYTYDDVLQNRFTKRRVTPRELLTTSPSRLLIHAAGGSGKTSFLIALAQAASNEGIIPFFLDLRMMRTEARDSTTQLTLKDIFEQASVAGTYSGFASALDGQRRTILIIDGLNEIAVGVADQVLTQLDRAAAKPNVSIVVADRMTSRTQATNFRRASIEPLTFAEIRKLLPESVPISDGSSEQKLLSLPFFLELFLGLQPRGAASPRRREMLLQYFQEVVKLSMEQVRGLQTPSYEAYRRYRKRAFEKDWWQEQVSGDIADRLTRSGAVTELPVEKAWAVFRHQLLHDFLVGGYLASLSEWPYDVLKTATLDASSFEALSFAAEIAGGARLLAFLEHVYDWNYVAASSTVADLLRNVGPQSVPAGISTVFAAVQAEKLFDPFEETVGIARQHLRALGQSGADLLGAKTPQDIRDWVARTLPNGTSFDVWKALFLSDGNVSEEEIPLIVRDPITGWTASNVFRRRRLDPLLQAQLRLLYREHETESIRWRVVHTLGAQDAPENLAILEDALKHDRPETVRYGAVRSLMEAAFRVPEQRIKALQVLKEGLPSIATASKALTELRRTAFVRGADQAWFAAVLPLLEEARKMVNSSEEIEHWEQRLAEIRVAAAERE